MNYKILFLSLCSFCLVAPILTPFLAPFLVFTGLETALEWKAVRDSRELPTTTPSQEEAQPTKEERMKWLLDEEPPTLSQEEAQPTKEERMKWFLVPTPSQEEAQPSF